ncbi:hypothetical protein SEA_WOFFORD_262 [Streptomyces phage Wofford]|uniref:Uncharacterized protein n=1 Tax=Streptomyces phage Wofford TaxID=2283267 RepID=A0A345MA75_9CAUD|nr:hypothetical protein HWB78_gp004 [Streptomyces phage Wollford]YP_009839905.1 hypothetical protein HWB78_gp057 [Streptomyces phage Wollford]AXH67202.1 hypothetical protein SEA_WOFFORD_4 [Streptomyces phage Wollford]AXH67396.1 hypothetical protein SEA_WOFFORD_262 [Streptomyces phage Wollford]
MIVYRVALSPKHEGNLTGKWAGPYREGWDSFDPNVKAVSNRLCREHVDESHPTPWTDLPGGISPNEFCVLISEGQLAKWFENFGHDLDAAGYSVVAYDVPAEKVRSGTYQSVAAVTDSDIVGIYEPLGMIP